MNKADQEVVVSEDMLCSFEREIPKSVSRFAAGAAFFAIVRFFLSIKLCVNSESACPCVQLSRCKSLRAFCITITFVTPHYDVQN